MDDAQVRLNAHARPLSLQALRINEDAPSIERLAASRDDKNLDKAILRQMVSRRRGYGPPACARSLSQT
jgi:hypothetical protein